MDTSGNGEGDLSQSDSDGVVAKPPSKRAKGKSKVWEKVAWFTRRSRSRDNQSEHAFIPDAETASLPHDHMDYDLSPTASTSDISPMNSQPWLESSSSSDGEPFDYQERYNSKRTRLYPNSEVVEQNCLKPSLARALFLQMEAASRGSRTPTKYAWQKKKKRSYAMTYGESYCNGRPDSMLVGDGHVGRTVSVPHEITVSTQESCHCAACCSCPNGGRLFGACSFEQNLNSSTQSLDTALSRSLLCKKEPDQLITDPPDSSNKSSKDDKNAKLRVQGEASQYKSNSLPTYYRNSVHRHQDTPPNKWHLAICDRLLEDTASTPTVCECKTNATDDLVKQQRQRKPDVLNKVGPTEFRQKFESMKQWFQDFNDEQKNLVLKEILGDCGLPQIHLLSLEMEPRLHEGCPLNCQDLISWLPNSLALYIMSFLDAVSLCQASIVCRAWYQLANEPCLWRRLCCQAKWRLLHCRRTEQLIHHMLPDSNIDWKRVFSERFRLRNNWLRGRCNVRTFEGHTQGISCVQFDDTRIVSGSSDKTIKVWNIRTNTPWSVQTLVGHSGTVRCLHLEGNRLVSGSTDRTIKVWDLSTQQSWCSIACKVTMVGHLDTVRCLQVDDEKVISGSYDKTLKVWDIRSGECRRTLRGHGAAVLCVQFDKDKLMSGSADKTIKVWNFDGQCIMTLHGHHDAVTCLQFDTTRIISGSLDCTLKFWNITSGDCMNTIDWKASEGHTGVVRCLQADSWRVVSASDDRTLKVWSIETGQRLVTLRNHTDGVTCLQFNDSIIVSGSYDKTVKLWDFSVC